MERPLWQLSWERTRGSGLGLSKKDPEWLQISVVTGSESGLMSMTLSLWYLKLVSKPFNSVWILWITCCLWNVSVYVWSCDLGVSLLFHHLFFFQLFHHPVYENVKCLCCDFDVISVCSDYQVPFPYLKLSQNLAMHICMSSNWVITSTLLRSCCTS